MSLWHKKFELLQFHKVFLRSKRLRNVCMNIHLQSVKLAIPARVVIGTLGVSPFILACWNSSETSNKYINIYVKHILTDNFNFLSLSNFQGST